MAQRELWPFLREVPKDFVLYGGTAVALRCGHRQSVDFDFFSTRNDPNVLSSTEKLSFVSKYATKCDLQTTRNNSSQAIYNLCMSDNTNVQVTFVRDSNWIGGAVKQPDTASDNRINIASPIDLMATKIDSMIQRKAIKDFIDVAELVSSGISFQKGLSALLAIRKDNLVSEISDINTFIGNMDYDGEEFIKSHFYKDETINPNYVSVLTQVANILVNEAANTDLRAVIKNSSKIKVSEDLSFSLRYER
ncbi:MAG: nucleotidyl transferase AbiEii/AbiGii toxin family protein [Synergistaceae bacterium]|nr:nucleotidyl transferase AbiEii/AbiGii toxin family protein [Synergistaceae bacterium]